MMRDRKGDHRCERSRRRGLQFEALEARHLLAVYTDGGVSRAVPDGARLTSTIGLPALAIQDLDVGLSLSHSRVSDLEVFLINPSGTRVRLFGFVGRPGQDFQGSIFDDEASRGIVDGADTFRMRLRPDETLSKFDGASAAGLWTLDVADRVSGVAGTLHSWSLRVNEPAPELSLTGLRFVTSNNLSRTAPVPDGGHVAGLPDLGDVIYLRAEWTAKDLTSADSYRVRFFVDGSPLQSALLTGGPSHTGNHSWYLGGWQATAGLHTAEVRLDADDGVRESNESDNRLRFTFQVLDLAPAGDEFAVSELNQLDQTMPNVAIDDAGNQLFVWQGRTPDLWGDPVNYVFGRRYNALGQPLGPTFLVGGEDFGVAPSMAMHGSGRFVVAVDSGAGIALQQFNADGTPRGPAQSINGDFPADAWPITVVRPAVALDAAGNGVVVWSGAQPMFAPPQPFLDGDQSGIYARRFLANGGLIGEPFLVNRFTAGDQTRPAVAMSPRGDWTVSWISCTSSSSSCRSYVRTFDALGQPFGDEQTLDGAHGFPPGYDSRFEDAISPVGVDALGDFVSLAQSTGWHRPATGGDWEDRFSVSATATGIAMHDSGSFATVAEFEGDIVVALFDADAKPLNAPRHLQANRTNSEIDNATGVAAIGSSGDFVVAWRRASASNPFGPGRQIYARRYRWNLGDFEKADLAGAGLAATSGDQVAWGGTVDLEFVVKNFGANLPLASATASKATLYLSSNAIITTADLVLAADVPVPPLDGGESSTIALPELRLPVRPSQFPAEGVVYVGLRVDVGRDVDESNETNNSNRGRGLDLLALRIGPPRLVTVLTHGLNFDPASLGPLPTSEFMQPWRETYASAVLNAAQGTEWEGQVEVFVGEWDSNTGFWHGLADELALHYLTHMFVMDSPLQILVDPELLKDYVDDVWKTLKRETRLLIVKALTSAALLVHNHLDVARGLAATTARDIVRQLTDDDGPLGPPQAGQCVQLIGHSRGAAVNARVAQLLARRGYGVDEYVSLDGLSIDWPEPVGWIGDFDIIRPVAFDVDVPRRINARVADGLGAAATRYALTRLPGVDADDAARMVHALYRLELPNWSPEDWLAPERIGFENIVVTAPNGASSNHITVDDLYFESTTRAAGQQYLRNGLLGAATPALCQPSNGESEPPQPGVGAVGEWSEIRDGTFDRLARQAEDFAALAPLATLNDEFLAPWIASLDGAQRLLAQQWLATGDVSLVDAQVDPALRLVQTADTSIGQVVLTDGLEARLTFKLSVDAAGPDDALEIVWGDSILATIPLEQSPGSSTRTLSLPIDAGSQGVLRWRLVGPASTPSVIRLDDLSVLSTLALGDLEVSPPGPAVAYISHWTVESSADMVSTVSRVDFFQESNGIPGLQADAGGDRWVGGDIDGRDGWSLQVDVHRFAPVNHVIYARGADLEGRTGAAAQTILPIAQRTDAWRNPLRELDVNDDGSIAPGDVLLIVNELNAAGAHRLEPPLLPPLLPPPYFDVDGDSFVAPIDALAIINHLNRLASGEAEPDADSPPTTPTPPIASPHAFAQLEIAFADHGWLDSFATAPRTPTLVAPSRSADAAPFAERRSHHAVTPRTGSNILSHSPRGQRRASVLRATDVEAATPGAHTPRDSTLLVAGNDDSDQI